MKLNGPGSKQKEISGSGQSMHGFLLTYPRLCRENHGPLKVPTELHQKTSQCLHFNEISDLFIFKKEKEKKVHPPVIHGGYISAKHILQ